MNIDEVLILNADNGDTSTLRGIIELFALSGGGDTKT